MKWIFFVFAKNLTKPFVPPFSKMAANLIRYYGNTNFTASNNNHYKCVTTIEKHHKKGIATKNNNVYGHIGNWRR